MAENLHKNLPDAAIHNPKGFATANDDTYLTKDSTGGLSWAPKPSGGRAFVEANIGDWNMDITDSVNYAHGLSATEWKTIRNLSCIIRNDADSIYTIQNYKAELDIYVNSTNIVVRRVKNGFFDANTDYDSTSYNRGFIIFEYTQD